MSTTPAPKRRWLTFSLRTFLAVTLALSLVLGYFGRVWWKAYRDSQPPTLSELAQIAKRHGIPMPPKDAKLVLVHTGASRQLGPFSSPTLLGIYSPAFLLEKRKDGSVVVLHGAEEIVLEPRYDSQSLDRTFSVALTSEQSSDHLAEFRSTSALVCAIQLADRGDSWQAKQMFDRVAKEEWWEDENSVGYDPEYELLNLRRFVARCAFNHQQQLLLDRSQWRAVRTSLETLFAEFPALEQDEPAEVYAGLAQALDAPAPKPGSTEALLVEWSERKPRSGAWYFWHSTYGSLEPPARSIVLRGFDSVPDLIALRDDKRITTHWRPAIMNSNARVQRFGELADQLLNEIAPPGNDPDSRRTSTADWQAWWNKAKEQGEQSVLADAVFRWQDKRIVGINVGPARIIAHKFPNGLAKLCQEFCSKTNSDTQSFDLADAVAQSNLPLEQRRDMLAEFAQCGPLAHQRCALQALAPLDPERCAELVLPLIETLPADASGTYWTCPEAGLAHVVVRLSDVEVWRAYLRAARRSSVGLRLEMIDSISDGGSPEHNRQLQLAFLAAFLDDDTVRDNSVMAYKYDGPSAASQVTTIKVCDFVAGNLASMLDLDAKRDASWSPEQWSALRGQVRERLAQEKLPALE